MSLERLMSAILGIQTVKKTVCYIFSGKEVEKSLAVNPLGTGFFVLLPNPREKGKFWGIFVTAKHVLKNKSGEYYPEIFVRANLKNWSPNDKKPGIIWTKIPVTDRDGNLEWLVHPNPAVDLAVLPMFPNPETHDIWAVPSKAFLTYKNISRIGVLEGQEIFLPCFTPEIPQYKRNYPIVRFGRIALISTEEFPAEEGNTKLHFAECFPFGGNSGAPVFIRKSQKNPKTDRIEDEYGLLGILKAHYYTEYPILQLTQSSLWSSQHMGIAVITPVDYLREILNNELTQKLNHEPAKLIK